MATKDKTKRKGKKSSSKGKRKSGKPGLTAKSADRHALYQQSVQSPEEDSAFFARHFKRATGRPARLFREDFCGTGLLSCHWVLRHRDNRAVGVDYDTETVEWGRTHNLATLLDDDQRDRIELIEDNVMNVIDPKVDLIAGLNFSYAFFMTRAELRSYFELARNSLADDGVLFIDAWGGSETQVEQEEHRKQKGFTYVWDQHRFDPVTHRMTCKIHFEFKDGTRMRNAFVYKWRLWTLPELQELMAEAGFREVDVLWEGTDRDTEEGNGIYRKVEKGEADPAWIAYVVGRK